MTGGESQFWTCIPENAAGKFYIGSTDDLDRRVVEHNDPDRPRSKYTAKHGPWKLVWSKSHPTRAEAMAGEQQIKNMKSAKWIRRQLLIEHSNSTRSAFGGMGILPVRFFTAGPHGQDAHATERATRRVGVL